ncbi:MAG: hypothetical protein IPN71_04685 [Fibrobacteres bacterium]|nr:hypothetical protein [Fibrobacterota bacterium]
MSQNPNDPSLEPDSLSESIPTPKGVGWWQFLMSVAVCIGVVGWAAPWILAKVRASRLTASVALVGELRAGVGRYQSDVGTILPLDPAGQGVSRLSSSVTEPWSLSWVLTQEIPPSVRGAWSRFRGPYLRRVRLDTPPLGRDLRLDAAGVGTGRGSVSVPGFHPATLGGETAIPQGHTVVWLTIDRVDHEDFLRFDERIDRFSGKSVAPEQQGEALWTPKDGGTLQVLILHR